MWNKRTQIKKMMPTELGPVKLTISTEDLGITIIFEDGDTFMYPFYNILFKACKWKRGKIRNETYSK